MSYFFIIWFKICFLLIFVLIFICPFLQMQTFVPILETIWFINSNICPGVCSKGDVKAFLHCIRAESPAWHSKAVKSFSTSNSSPNFSNHLRTYSRPLIATHICKIVLFCFKLFDDPIDENSTVYNKLTLLFCISNCVKSNATFKHVWNICDEVSFDIATTNFCKAVSCYTKAKRSLPQRLPRLLSYTAFDLRSNRFLLIFDEWSLRNMLLNCISPEKLGKLINHE